MAVPKKKTSKSRRNMRRSHHALKPPAYAECPELRRAEAAAPCLRACGHYDGREVAPQAIARQLAAAAAKARPHA